MNKFQAPSLRPIEEPSEGEKDNSPANFQHVTYEDSDKFKLTDIQKSRFNGNSTLYVSPMERPKKTEKVSPLKGKLNAQLIFNQTMMRQNYNNSTNTW